jgi:hypothetical protein
MGIASGVVARTKYPSAYERPLRARSRRSRSLWTKPQTSCEKVKTFLRQRLTHGEQLRPKCSAILTSDI